MLAFIKEDRKTHDFCPPTPKCRAKIVRKGGCSQGFTNHFQPVAKVASLKKMKRGGKKGGVGGWKERQKTPGELATLQELYRFWNVQRLKSETLHLF